MAAAGEQAQAGRAFVSELRLWQDAPSDSDHGIGGEDEGVAQLRVAAGVVPRHFRLGMREALHQVARQLLTLRRLIDVRREELVRLDADLPQELQPPRRGGGEHEARAVG